MSLYVGTSGFAYKPWKGPFYPAGLPDAAMLRFYGERFGAVEINDEAVARVSHHLDGDVGLRRRRTETLDLRLRGAHDVDKLRVFAIRSRTCSRSAPRSETAWARSSSSSRRT